MNKANIQTYFCPDVRFFEAEEFADQGNVFSRRDPLLTEAHYKSLMAQYNVKTRFVLDISHFLLDLLNRDSAWTIGNMYNLKDLRAQIASGGQFPHEFDPQMRSLDGILLNELKPN